MKSAVIKPGGIHIVLNGTSSTTGTFTLAAEGQSITQPIDSSPSAVPPLGVKVEAVACNEAYGQWAYSVEQAFEDQGFSGSIEGYWWAVRDTEAGRRIAENGWKYGTSSDGATTIFHESKNLIDIYNRLVDEYKEWTTQDILNFLEAVEIQLNTYRNFTPCDLDLFGEDTVRATINGLIFIVQGLLLGLYNQDEAVDAKLIWHLMQVAMRTGAIGAAAPNGEHAQTAEDSLKGLVINILNENLDPEDNRVWVNDETEAVMRLGSLMDWVFDLDGSAYSARKAYKQLLKERAALQAADEANTSPEESDE